MADVYKFKVAIKEVPDKIWRDIEISSLSSVAKLGYTILASFEAAASHLFNIKFNGKRYEIVIEDDFEFEPVIDPIKTKLSALKLSIGDLLEMEYDYGASWKFTIKLVAITEMKKGSGNHYPYVTAGQGRGIIEDRPPFELAEIIEKTDKTGILPQVCDNFLDEEIEWDYRKFDLEFCNIILKREIEAIQYAYEEY